MKLTKKKLLLTIRPGKQESKAEFKVRVLKILRGKRVKLKA